MFFNGNCTEIVWLIIYDFVVFSVGQKKFSKKICFIIIFCFTYGKKKSWDKYIDLNVVHKHMHQKYKIVQRIFFCSTFLK